MDRNEINFRTSGLANALSLDSIERKAINPFLDINDPRHPSNLPNYGNGLNLHPPSQDRGFTPNPTGMPGSTSVSTPGAAPEGLAFLLSREGPNNTYQTKNEAGSSAFGRYQFMPSTAKMYASKIGIDPNKWELPENQDRIMQYANQDYANYLNKWDRQDSPSNRYAVHQLGPARARRYFTDSLTDSDYKVMNDNLPSSLKAKDNNTIRQNWMNKYNPIGF